MPLLVGFFAFFLGVGAGSAGGESVTAASAESEPATTVTATATVPGAVPQDQLDALAARESELDQRQADLDAGGDGGGRAGQGSRAGATG